MPSNHLGPDEYSTPTVIRPASPASSIGTTYQRDQTSHSDSEMMLSHLAFDQKWEERIGLRGPRKEEEAVRRDPLLKPYPPPGSPDERRALMNPSGICGWQTDCAAGAFERIMTDLRRTVQDLVDNDLFEQTLLRGSKVGTEEARVTHDVDTILQSMMPGKSELTQPIADGPWNYSEARSGFGGTTESFQGSDATALGSRRKSRGSRPW